MALSTGNYLSQRNQVVIDVSRNLLFNLM